MAYLIEKLEEWAQRYERENARVYPEGPVLPKVVVGAVRGGVPYRPARTSGLCSAYVDVRVPPDRSLRDVEREFRAFVDSLGLGARVETFLARRGWAAQGAEPLVEALARAHRQVRGSDPPPGAPEERSMWRDINAFNEWGIPAVTFGPPRHLLGAEEAASLPPAARDPGSQAKYFLRQDMVQAAQVYALTALSVCGVAGR